MDDVIVDHPEVPLVICHAGNPWLRDTAAAHYAHDKVDADISDLILGDVGVAFEPRNLEEVQGTIADRSDPGNHQVDGTDRSLAARVPTIGLLGSSKPTEEDRACVAWRTADTVFDRGLEPTRR